ncbi:MAG: HD domain-containing protein [Deltaproteobacteria bacterium]|nr:HD domain-containing protein [Deltaproteobacteria bacterium]
MIFLDPADVALHPSPPVPQEHEGRRFSALVVSADREFAKTLATTLAIEGVEFEQARSSEGAWRALSGRVFSLIVADLDLGTPLMGLLAFLGKTRPDTSVIALANEGRRTMAVHALRLGALSYALKPVLPEEFTLLIAQARRQGLLARRLETLRLEQLALRADLEAQEDELCSRALEIAIPLSNLLEARGIESAGHLQRIGLYAADLGCELGWPTGSLEELRLAAELHDLGKICLSQELLDKSGSLTLGDLQQMQTHAELGATLFGTADIPFLKLARDIALSHHERWDGKGYPRRLEGEEIPLSARIVAVVDVYDALLHPRSYRPSMVEEEALAFMASERGAAFDPTVFDAFMDVLPLLQDVRRLHIENAA